MEERNNRILQLISLISVGALEYVQSAFERNGVTVLYYGESGINQGVLCLAEDTGCVIAYAAFSQCGEPGVLLNLINDRISPYLQPGEQREICFNVYGNNTEIIKFVRKLGFVSDLEGYQLQYVNDNQEYTGDGSLLTERGFTPEMLGSFIDLFDTAYEQLRIENGWETEQCSRGPESFREMLDAYEASGQVRSFWLRDRLAGAYIADGDFIRDLVVAPELQNSGYGKSILNRCINRMKQRPGENNIYLRVAASNKGALRFYERNQFVRTASFADHTYIRNNQ